MYREADIFFTPRGRVPEATNLQRTHGPPSTDYAVIAIAAKMPVRGAGKMNLLSGVQSAVPVRRLALGCVAEAIPLRGTSKKEKGLTRTVVST
jgi:hypothetical protein